MNTEFKSRNENFREYVASKMEANKFAPFIGLKFTEIEEGRISGTLDFEEKHKQQNGYLHGGVTSAILDMVQGFASYTLVENGQFVFTVEAKISYLNRGMGTKFYAAGWVIKPGKRFHFCEGEIWYMDEAGQKIIVAKGSATMAVV